MSRLGVASLCMMARLAMCNETTVYPGRGWKCGMGKMKYASEVSQRLCDDSHDPPPSQPAAVRAWIDYRTNGSLGWGESCRMTQDTADGLEVLCT